MIFFHVVKRDRPAFGTYVAIPQQVPSTGTCIVVMYLSNQIMKGEGGNSQAARPTDKSTTTGLPDSRSDEYTTSTASLGTRLPTGQRTCSVVTPNAAETIRGQSDFFLATQ